jgi:lysophosphatidate acyltransferase
MPRRSVVLAKKELKWVPFFGQYLIFSRAVCINRSRSKDSVASLRAAGQSLLSKDASLLVFPEGTRSLTSDCTLRGFKKGAFHVAIETGLPIIPVVFENQWRIYRPGVFNSGKCKIRGEPYPSAPSASPPTNSLYSLATYIN